MKSLESQSTQLKVEVLLDIVRDSRGEEAKVTNILGVFKQYTVQLLKEDRRRFPVIVLQHS
jgi:hypothetical protein